LIRDSGYRSYFALGYQFLREQKNGNLAKLSAQSSQVQKNLKLIDIRLNTITTIYAKLMNLGAIIARLFSLQQEGFQFIDFLASIFLGFHQNRNTILS